MAFGLFGGSDSGKKGDSAAADSVKRSRADRGSESGKRDDSLKKADRGSESGRSEDGGSDSVKSGDGSSRSDSFKGRDDVRCSSGGVRDEGSGSGSRKYATAERSMKEEDVEHSDSTSHSSRSAESSSTVVSEARKIQVKEAELEQAKLTAKDVHRRQEHVFGNFWSVSPLRWATLTGNMYALQKFRLLNSVPGEGGPEDVHFLELLNIVNEDGMNCLHLAANRGQCVELTQLLQHSDILCKSMTTMKEKIRHTAKLKSLQSLQRDLDFENVLSFLVSIPGIDLNAVDKKGNTPLILASASGHLKAVEVLLEASAEMDVLNEDGLNCLHIAASAGHSAVVDRIVQAAGLVDMRLLNVKSGNDCEWTALHYAVANSRIHTLELLLNYPDIAVDAQDREGCTPLILACSLGYVPAVRILLRRGANKFIKNDAMLNSSHVAAVSGHVEVLKELTDHSNKPPAAEVPIAVPIQAAAPCVSEDGSDEDTPLLEQELRNRFSDVKSPEFIVLAASSHSAIDEDEAKFHRAVRTPHEYRRSDQIHRSPAEISLGSDQLQSTVSLVVS